MNDQEYLANAGLSEDGSAIQSGSSSSGGSESSSGAMEAPPAAAGEGTPTQAQIEMFELNGNKFPVTTEFKFTHEGKNLSVPYSKLTNSYRQAQFYQNKYNEMKTKLGEFDKIKPEYEKIKTVYDKYNAIQEWSEKNPQEWARLWNIYQQKDQHLLAQQAGIQGDPQQNPLIQEISNLKKELGELKGVAGEYKTFQQQQAEARDVEHVKSEILSFKKDFPEINLEEKDPEGVALWAKIVSWGLENRFTDFTPAAMMFLKDRIAGAYQARALNQSTSQKQADFKQGIVKRSSAPILNGGQGQGQPLDVRKMSYGQLAQMAKDQLGATG